MTGVFAPLTSNAGDINEPSARFNLHVDTTFLAHVVLVGKYLPFDPETEEEVKQLFVNHTRLQSWDKLKAREGAALWGV